MDPNKLLPFAFDSSRATENVPLKLTQPRKRARINSKTQRKKINTSHDIPDPTNGYVNADNDQLDINRNDKKIIDQTCKYNNNNEKIKRDRIDIISSNQDNSENNSDIDIDNPEDESENYFATLSNNFKLPSSSSSNDVDTILANLPSSSPPDENLLNIFSSQSFASSSFSSGNTTITPPPSISQAKSPYKKKPLSTINKTIKPKVNVNFSEDNLISKKEFEIGSSPVTEFSGLNNYSNSFNINKESKQNNNSNISYDINGNCDDSDNDNYRLNSHQFSTKYANEDVESSPILMNTSSDILDENDIFNMNTIEPSSIPFGRSHNRGLDNFSASSISSFRDIMGSTPFSSFSVQQSKQQDSKAEQVITSAIENGKTSIDLDGFGLTEVPKAIDDLKNFVAFPERPTSREFTLHTHLRVLLSNNSISTLPNFLFSVDNITMLSLRHNKLTNIPSAIGRLVSLEELSLAGNSLTSIPSQILDLPLLSTLTVFPNMFIDMDAIESYPIRNFKDGFKINKNTSQLSYSRSTIIPGELFSCRKTRISYPIFNKFDFLSRAISPSGFSFSNSRSRSLRFSRGSSTGERTQSLPLYLHNGTENGMTNGFNDKEEERDNIENIFTKAEWKQIPSAPRLTELCLRILGKNRASERVQTSWGEIIEPHLKRIRAAYDSVERVDTCGICHRGPLVEPLATVYELWDGVLRNNGVVVRREVCSGICLRLALS